MLFIGIMSGTSTDGVDAALCRIHASDQLEVIHHYSEPFDAALRAEILQLNQSGVDELHRAALVSNQLADYYAHCTQQLLLHAQVPSSAITAIGVHGQTVRHAPHLGYTIQLNAPARLAELTKIHVVADFRSKDIAAGGQGAPLVPVFHQAVFGAPTPRVILNLGGIANISILRPQHAPTGFDTGPANALMDAWIQKHQACRFDQNGAWATQGTPDPTLLQTLLTEPWLALPPPKSTGRDLFNLRWLESHLQGTALAPVDVQATLACFTATTVAQAIHQHAADATEIILCGGGAYNTHLRQQLVTQIKKPIRLSDELGIGAQCVEAAAFAWLAYAYWQDIPAGQPSITGANHPSILGAWHKA